MDFIHQRTLRNKASCMGIGLHSGKPVSLSILPAAADHGIIFRRTDDSNRRVRARVENVLRTRFATTLSENGTSVATTEHLLSALYALGIDNAVLELDGAEVPILDGSAAPFLLMVHEAGIQKLEARRRLLVIEEPVSLTEHGSTICVEPASGFEVSYAIDFPHPIIAAQRFEGSLERRTYIEEIAPARTFCFLRDVEGMRRLGLALGGSLDNAVVVADHGVLNESLRFPDEFVRHKVLDLIGDLALLGATLVGRVSAERAGHHLHTRLVQEILSRPGSWSLKLAEPELSPVFAQHSLASAPVALAV